MAAGTWKRWAVAVLLAGTLLTVPSVQAQQRRGNKCGQRMRQAEQRLQQAIRKHGPRSKQARERRRQLDLARERCGGL